MEFEVKTVYHKRDMAAAFMAWQQKEGQLERMRRAIRRLHRVAAAPIALVGIYLLADTVLGSFDLPRFCASLLMFAVCVGMLRSGESRYYGFLAWRSYPNKGHELVFRLYADRIEAQDGEERSDYSYENLEWMGEDAQRFVLLWAGGQSVILRKQDFTCGRAEDLTAFLQSVSGKNMIALEV